MDDFRAIISGCESVGVRMDFGLVLDRAQRDDKRLSGR